MTTAYLIIEWPQLALTAVFLLAAALLSACYRLGLHRDLMVGGVRCVVQLLLTGYVLRLVFELDSVLLVLAVLLTMGFFATRIAGQRVKEKSVPFFWPTFFAIQVTFFTVAFVVTSCIIGAVPWWAPQYIIPIGGMLAGNAMNTIALALDRFFSELRQRRDEVELRLLMGADGREACEEIFRNALRAGMIPAINSLMGVGLVSLPGMMTGQILAGAAPEDAVRYQVVVMLMLVATTALVSFLALFWVRRRCFGPGLALVLDHGKAA